MRRLVMGAVALAMIGSVAAPASAQWQDTTAPDGETFTIVDSPATDPTSLRQSDYRRLMAIPSTDTGYRPPMEETPEELACPKSRCRDVAVPVPDTVHISNNMVRIYYPVGYRKPANRTKRYPVVYLYPGARSPYTRWSTILDLRGITQRIPAIFVMPEGGVGKDAGMFSDWVDGTWQYETYHVDYLAPWIAAHTRALPGATGGVGASAGGLGALNYAARHPGFLQGVLSISGVADTTILTGNALPEQVSSLIGLSPPDLTRVWGNRVLNAANWDAHNPAMNAAALKDVALFIASGTGYASNETPTGDPIHTPSQEMLLWTSHRTFLQALVRAGVSYQARIRQGGTHYWNYFAGQLRWGLPKLVNALYAKAGTTPPYVF